MPSKAKPRNQRISPEKTRYYVAWSFLFAMETAMRQSEILAMRRADLKDGFVHLPFTKNGEPRNVPLSKEAKRLLALLPGKDALVPIDKDKCCATWTRVKNKADLPHINFHDSRHESITRMVKDNGLPVEVLAKITGHKTIGMLVNTYYNPDAQDLVEMLNKTES